MSLVAVHLQWHPAFVLAQALAGVSAPIHIITHCVVPLDLTHHVSLLWPCLVLPLEEDGTQAEKL